MLNRINEEIKQPAIKNGMLYTKLYSVVIALPWNIAKRPISPTVNNKDTLVRHDNKAAQITRDAKIPY